MRTITLLLVAFLGALFAGCGSDSGSSKEGGPEAAVAAVVNGRTITLNDVSRVARNMKKQGFRPPADARGTTLAEKLYYTVVDRLVEQALILEDAEERGMSVGDAEVEAGISQIQVNAGGPDSLDAYLAEVGATREDLRRDMGMNMLTQKYMEERVIPNVTVTEAEIQEYYRENPGEFRAKPEVRARHILLEVDPAAGEMERAEVRRRAQGILERARGGDDFAALARETSEDEITAPAGGDLGWFGSGRMVAPFDSAAFALEPGEVSGLVLTDFGYHIIKLEETRMAEAKSLEESRGPIERYLRQMKFQEDFQDTMKALKAGAEIEITPPTPEILEELAS